MNQDVHIERAFETFTTENKASNRLRLKASIDAIRYLAFQGCAFRGHDESRDSSNRGNFIELIKVFGSYDQKVEAVVLDKAPGNASYTSPRSQKEICHVFATRVKKTIRAEIGNSKFCLLVDEARDVSTKEQMSLILRFVDNGGLVQERFFGLVHVPNTSAITLKEAIYFVLSNNNLDIQNIRGQGYDGAELDPTHSLYVALARRQGFVINTYHKSLIGLLDTPPPPPRRRRMSWQTYVDEHLMCEIEGNHLTSAAILGKDGSVWAQSDAFPQFKPEEIFGIINDFDQPGSLAPTGLFLGGTKYMVIQGEAGAVIRGKKPYLPKGEWRHRTCFQWVYKTRATWMPL